MSERPDDTSVRVTVRIRPQLARERIDMCQVCTSVTPSEAQIVLGKDKAFTYDYVCDMDSTQDNVYELCSKALIEGCLEGYNATILAYGQTGSGKTYTMGTGFDVNIPQEEVGIIPRAVHHLFSGIEERRKKAVDNGEPPPDFRVNAQFLELYNEEIHDLLDNTRDHSDKGHKSHIKIHEDASGGIYTVGVTTRLVNSLEDTIHCLKIGALSRTTASTNMNAQSSRSHAIFTLYIKQQRVVKEQLDGSEDEGKEKDTTEQINEFETLTAKFHFVDLAGSERLKRTGATGDRAKEGISINCGLLALGNVISALGDKLKRGSHVPYRDSKLTRLLQDSLGGNSRTVMIACVSPSDRDFMETLNTLKYANRARNIKNKVMVNQDKTSRQIAALRGEVLALQEELMEYKTGKRVVDGDGLESVNDMFHENTMLQTENNNLRQRIKALQQASETQTAKITELLADRDLYNITNAGDKSQDEVRKLIEGYLKETEELRNKLVESEALVESAKRMTARTPRTSVSPVSIQAMSRIGTSFEPLSPENHIDDILDLAKKDVKKLRKKTRRKHQSQSSEKEDGSDDEKQDNRQGEEDLEKDEVASEEEQEDKEEEDLEDLEEDEVSSESETDEAIPCASFNAPVLDEDFLYDDLDASLSAELKPLEHEDTDNLHEDLADLTCEISIKQKLIEELEMSQKRLQTMKAQYENKLMALQVKIKNTELERDKVLSNLGDRESQSQGRNKKVKEEYEKKLNDMHNELKKLHAAKKEHAKLLRNQSHYEKQLKTLQRDLTDMKKLKVKLMNQIKEDATKNRRTENIHNREIAQLKKEQRLKDSHIRSLEADRRQRDVILRRKQEEVESLRRRKVSTMSAKVAGRVGKYNRPTTVPINPVSAPKKRRRVLFSAKAAKSKWDSLSKTVSSIIVKKQTLSHMERDMERWLRQRENLGKKLEKFMKKRERATTENKDETFIRDLNDQIDTLRTNITFVQENINDCQTNIMSMEEGKDEEVEPMSMVNQCGNLEEAKYLLEHFLSLVISKGIMAAQKDADNKELLAKLHQEKMDSTFQRDMLQYLIQDKVDIEIDDSIIRDREDSDSGSECSSGSSSPVESSVETSTQPVATPSSGGAAAVDPMMLRSSLESLRDSNSSITGKKDKARRKTANPMDMLYAGGGAPGEGAVAAAPPLLKAVPERPAAEKAAVMNGSSTQTTTAALMPPPKTLPPRVRQNGIRSDAGPGRPDTSPALPRKTYTKSVPEPSPVMKRKSNTSNANPPNPPPTSSTGSLSRIASSNENADTTPPASPSATRRNKGVNVFSRLTSQTHPTSPHPSRGVITTTSTRSYKTSPLVLTHTAVGHSKAVLSLYATEQLLFSSSKDRTVKIWDLNEGQEVLTLDGHPNNVSCVRFSEETALVYTVSTYFVKVWDVRLGNKCIKTLTSSGMTNEGPIPMNVNSRQVTCPAGETNINDIALNSTGTVLYSAGSNTVRIWDLRTYKSIGKLSGGHQAAVMVLAVDDTDTADGNICVVTGSKDHYIKVFEVMEDSVGVLTPKCNLEPPHYDGIQSLCLMGDLLFSGSRDTCIKKWDLAEQQLKHSINNSHKDWICGLAFMPGGNCLLSGCRGGMLKMWHIDNCTQLGEIKAHSSPINAITTNSGQIFTASNDRTVRFWCPRGSLEPSDSSDNE